MMVLSGPVGDAERDVTLRACLQSAGSCQGDGEPRWTRILQTDSAVWPSLAGDAQSFHAEGMILCFIAQLCRWLQYHSVVLASVTYDVDWWSRCRQQLITVSDHDYEHHLENEKSKKEIVQIAVTFGTVIVVIWWFIAFVWFYSIFMV